MVTEVEMRQDLEYQGYTIRVKGDNRVEIVDKYGKCSIVNNAENAKAWADEMGPAPDVVTLDSIDPASAEIGSADLTVTLTGTNFNDDVRMIWNGAVDACEVVSDTQITTTVKASMATVAVDVPVQLMYKDYYLTPPLTFSFVEPAAP
jgi:IPT/TIG domain